MDLCDFVIFLSIFVNYRHNALVHLLKNLCLILVLPKGVSIIVLQLCKNHWASTCLGFLTVLSSFYCHHTQSKSCRSPLSQAIRDLGAAWTIWHAWLRVSHFRSTKLASSHRSTWTSTLEWCFAAAPAIATCKPLHKSVLFCCLMVCYRHLRCASAWYIHSWRQMTECVSVWQVIHNWVPGPRWPSFMSQLEVLTCRSGISPLN